ncbi:MAG: GDSL-type esterase/lipase family protein [Planctomycetaceae bacterium]
MLVRERAAWVVVGVVLAAVTVARLPRPSWGQEAVGAGNAPGLPHAGRWEQEVAALEREDRAVDRVGGICFVGSSNIRLWSSLADDFPGWHVARRGVGGSQLHELVPVALRLVGHSRPGVIVVSAGINDIHAGRSAADVASAFADFVATVRRTLPRTTIVFLAIAPSFARWHERDEQARANALVREIVAAGDRLAYVDAARAYLRPDGLPAAECFVTDGLHPTPVGYARRAAVLRPLLAPFLAP